MRQMFNSNDNQEIERGQSFNYESTKQLIYYYSVSKPLPENIADDLIISFQIKEVLLAKLPKIWFVIANQTAYVLIEKKPRYVTSNFILDMFIYSWTNGGITKFKYELSIRLQKLTIEDEKLDRLVDIFKKEIHEIMEIRQNEKKLNKQLTYDKSCIQPLIVFKDQGKSKTNRTIKFIDELDHDDDNNNSTLSSSQISQTISNKETDRSKSDVRDVTLSLQMNKMRKFTKQIEKMTENIFESLLTYNDYQEQWQVARESVVIILEMNIKAEDYLKNIEKVRFIQPSTSFYKKALQVWILVKSSQKSKILFKQFLCKARHFFGNNWNDKLAIPLYTLFQIAEAQYLKVQEEIDITQRMNVLSFLLQQKLVEMWQQNLMQCAKTLICQ